MIKNISQYFNVFKRPKTLKMRAKNAYSAFKRKTIDTSEKVKKFAKKNKKSIAIGLGTTTAFGAGYMLGKKNGKR